VHQAYRVAAEDSPVRWLHIAEAVAEEAVAQGFGSLGVTGTEYLMSGPVYRGALERFDIRHRIPDIEDRRRINRIIFDELVKGRFSDESRKFFSRVFDRLAQSGCDAVVMGCTEIPILMDDVDTVVPTLDSTRILARAALRHAMN
jgi:aspartate racemase